MLPKTHSVSAAGTSNQDLYELVLDMRAAALQLPAIQSATVLLLDPLAKITNEQAVKCPLSAALALGVAALGLSAWSISWLVDMCGLGTILGAIAVIGGVVIAVAACLCDRSPLLAEWNGALASMSHDSVGLHEDY